MRGMVLESSTWASTHSEGLVCSWTARTRGAASYRPASGSCSLPRPPPPVTPPAGSVTKVGR